jgi:hypothetical protein
VRGQTAAQRAARRGAQLERDRKRVAIAKVYREYCKTTTATNPEAAHRRPILLDVLKRLTNQTNDREALVAGAVLQGSKTAVALLTNCPLGCCRRPPGRAAGFTVAGPSGFTPWWSTTLVAASGDRKCPVSPRSQRMMAAMVSSAW